jgi:hypothetical protein
MPTDRGDRVFDSIDGPTKAGFALTSIRETFDAAERQDGHEI